MIIKYKRVVSVLIVAAILVLPLAFSVSYAKWTGGANSINASVNVGQWNDLWGKDDSVAIDWIKNSGDGNMGVMSSVGPPSASDHTDSSGSSTGLYIDYMRWFGLGDMGKGAQFKLYGAYKNGKNSIELIKCINEVDGGGGYVKKWYDENTYSPIMVNGQAKIERLNLGENGHWKINNQVPDYVSYSNGVFTVEKDLAPYTIPADGSTESMTFQLMIKITIKEDMLFRYYHVVDICSCAQYVNNKSGA